MRKFAVIVEIEVSAEQRERLLPLLLAHRARCLEGEPGTLQYDVLVPQDDETRLFEYAVFSDEAAFQTHRVGSSIARWREETADMALKLHVMRFALTEPQTSERSASPDSPLQSDGKQLGDTSWLP